MPELVKAWNYVEFAKCAMYLYNKHRQWAQNCSGMTYKFFHEDDYMIELPGTMLKEEILEWLVEANLPFKMIAIGKYSQKIPKGSNPMIIFDDPAHAVMFKLTWGGSV